VSHFYLKIDEEGGREQLTMAAVTVDSDQR